jgi:tRNA(Ile)-lysidine synthase
MEIKVPRGIYVVAVSGGVDSVTLLDLLSREAGIKLIIAHFNHGIREEASKDEKLVRELAKKYDWPVEIGQGNLGPSASEEAARKARYEFLEDVREKHAAAKIITAHHQDDLIETAIINLLRGTGRRGLTAIVDNPNVLRPLLSFSKKEILAYAKSSKLNWHEDSTNQDPKYLRNYVRQSLLPNLNSAQRQKLLGDLDKLSKTNKELDASLDQLSDKIKVGGNIIRAEFINLPTEVSNELMAFWLKEQGVKDYDRKLVNQLGMALKTARPGTRHNVKQNLWLTVELHSARFSLSK